MFGKTMRILCQGTIAVALFVAIAVLPPAALAEGEPITRSPLTPPAAGYTVEPRTLESFVDVFANANLVAAEAPVTSVTIPLGRRALDSVVSEINATVQMAFACQNAGDYARFLALLTDHALVTIVPWVAEKVVDKDMAAERIPATPRGEEILQPMPGVGAVTSVGDGRYTAYLDPNGGDAVCAPRRASVNVDGVVDFQVAE